MTNWWHGLQPREQRLIISATILGMVVIIYSLIWAPLIDSRDARRLQVQNSQTQLVWMQTQAKHIQRIKLANPNSTQASNSRSLLAVVDSLANQLGLRSAIQQIEPDGQSQATLWINSINFDALMTMLGELEKKAQISVSEASIDRLENSGMVKATLVLRKE